MLDVCLLGTGGTMPLKNRWLSSALFRYNGSCILMDCGEGTQIALKSAAFTFKPIDVICITHFHADHISGLPGMLLSMGNEGRTAPVLIIGPKGTRKVVSSLRIIAPGLPFEVEIAEIENNEETYYFDGYTITAFKVRHAVDCYGYRIDIARAGKFDVEKAKLNNVPLKAWGMLQKEDEVEVDGKKYTSNMVLGNPRKGISVVFSTDTRPCELLKNNCSNADLLILEGMYGSDEKDSKAREAMHMTFSEAATIAADSGASRLWLTHFSPSMPNPEDFEAEARAIFEHTEIGYDSKCDTLRFIDD
ncbi:MAG: ribonuclease Z [Ruminococcaceae bacterium]|nr:ribonuclease Z [Oscillospiraceae bacterium]